MQPPVYDVKYGTDVRDALEQMNLCLSDLAHHLGVTRQYISWITTPRWIPDGHGMRERINQALQELFILSQGLLITNELDSFIERIKLVHNKKPKIFINGCFDILHSGHTQIFKEAMRMKGEMFLSINDDDYIIKHKKRKPNPVMDRIAAIQTYPWRAIYVNPYEDVAQVLERGKFNFWLKGITYLRGDSLNQLEVGEAFHAGTHVIFINAGHDIHSTHLTNTEAIE